MLFFGLFVILCCSLDIHSVDADVCSQPTVCEYTYDINSPMSCYCSPACQINGSRLLCFYTSQVKSNCSSSCSATKATSACQNLCCYRDCQPEQWGYWSSCQGPCGNRTGTQIRTRIVLANNTNQCGGKDCGALSETQTCLTSCCVKDCQWTEWSTWNGCNNTCGPGYDHRNRTYLINASCGGQPCNGSNMDITSCEVYENVDCLMSSWSDWSTCVLTNNFCGDGIQTRTRSIITPSNCNGTSCGPTTDTINCKGPCCKTDCQVTQWTTWSFCNVSCGAGFQNRSRSIITINSCGGSECPTDTFQTLPCNKSELRNCTLSEWSAWSPCNNSCGSGNQTRSRNVTLDEACGGICVDNLTDIISCKSYTASLNCVVSSWSAWTSCVVNCNGGSITRSRQIIHYPVCRGVQCPQIQQASTCIPVCDQLCNNGTCSCNPGYTLSSNGYSCMKIVCFGQPNNTYNPPNLQYSTDYQYVSFYCPSTVLFGDICTVNCSNVSLSVQGNVANYTCQFDGTFNYQKMFCGPKVYKPIDVNLDVTNVAEGSPNSTCFGTLKTIYKINLTIATKYSLIENFENRLIINGSNLCLNYVPNFEAPNNSWSVLIQMTDTNMQQFKKSFTVAITDVNEPPNSCEFDRPAVIPENVDAHYLVGFLIFQNEDGDTSFVTPTINYTDTNDFEIFYDDSQPTHKYGVRTRNTASALFLSMGGASCSLNYERRNSYELTILAEKSGNPPVEAQFTIKIGLLDENDAPSAVLLNISQIAETIATGTIVAKLSIVDEDNSTQSYQYEIVDEDGQYFSIVDGNLLKLVKHLDYEEIQPRNISVSIKGTDNGNPSKYVISNISISVVNINEPPEISLVTCSVKINGTYTINATKNIDKDVAIFSVYAMDQDIGEKLSFAISNAVSYINLVHKGCRPLGKQNCSTVCLIDVLLNASFNFQTNSFLEFVITVVDSNGLNTEADFRILVENPNDNTTANSSSCIVNESLNGSVTSVMISTENEHHNIRLFDTDIGCLLKISRSVTNGALCKLLTVGGEDKNQTFTYSLESYTNLFYIENDTIFIRNQSQLNTKEISQYDLNITVHTSVTPGESSNVSLLLLLEDVNNFPCNLSLNGSQILENSDIGTFIGTLSAQVDDNNAFLTFSLHPAESNFVLLKNILASNVVFDYEEQNTFYVNASVSDNGSPSLQIYQLFKISIIDVNDSPEIFPEGGTDRYHISISVFENSIMELTKFYVSDQDVGDSVTVTISGDVEIFSLKKTHELGNATEYSVLMEKAADYEMKNLYNVEVLATDLRNATASISISIYVMDVNEPPQNITIIGNNGSQIITISEQLVGPKIIAYLNVLDPDYGDTHQFFIETCDNCEGKFEFPNNQSFLFLKSNESLNYEDLLGLDVMISVKVVDSRNLSIVTTLRINVTDYDEPPIIVGDNITFISSYVLKNQTIYTFHVIDEDLNNGSNITCSLVKPLYGIILMQISQTWILQSTSDTFINESSVNFRISCTDISSSFNNTSIKDIFLSRDISAKEPVILHIDQLKTSIKENTEEIPIAMVRVISEYSEIPQKISLYNVTCSWSTPVNISLSENGTLTLLSAVNYETTPFFIVSCNLTTESSVQIVQNMFTIDDANDAMTDINLDQANPTVSEKTPKNMLIATITVSDEDANQLYSCLILQTKIVFRNDSVISSNLAIFKIHNTQIFSDADSPNVLIYNNVYSVMVTIRCFEYAMPISSVTKEFTINVTNVNDSPTSIILDIQSNEIPENMTVGSDLCTITVSDEDKSDIHICQSSNALFEIHNNSLVLVQSLNYEVEKTIETTIVCTDAGGLSVSKSVKFTIINVDEAPGSIGLTNKEWPENSSIGSLISNVTATDPEYSNVQFALVSCQNMNCPFTLSRNGSVYLNQTLSNIAEGGIEFSISASDDGNNAAFGVLYAAIIRSHPLVVELSFYNVQDIPENASPGYPLLNINLTFLSQFHSNFDCTASALEGDVYADSMVVYLNSTLNFESSTILTVSVSCYSNPNQILATNAIILNVTNVDEPIRELMFNPASPITEGNLSDVYIGKIFVVDPEESQNINCSSIDANLTFVSASDSCAINCPTQFSVLLSGSFNYEDLCFGFNFSIRCQDNVSSLVQEFTIKIKDSNDAPTDILVNGSTIIDLTSITDNQHVGQLQAVDEDQNQTYMFLILPPCSKYFKVIYNNILVIRNVQYAWPGSFNCSITVIDNGIPSMNLTVNQTFTFIQSGGYVILSNYTIDAFASADTIIGNISFSSSNFSSDQLVFRIDSATDNAFSITGDSLILSKNASDLLYDKINIIIEAYYPLNDSVISRTNIRLVVQGISICRTTANYCNANASCKSDENGTSFDCLCNNGFVGNGINCSEINECDPTPCLGYNSTCTDLVSDFVCQCEQGRTGRICEIVENAGCTIECVNGLCLNDTCMCNPGWDGSNCNSSINDCINIPCNGNGLCVDYHMGYVCNCYENFTGPLCEQYLNGSCESGEMSILLSNETSMCIANFNLFTANIAMASDTSDNSKLYENVFYQFLRKNLEIVPVVPVVTFQKLTDTLYNLTFGFVDDNGMSALNQTTWNLTKDSCGKTVLPTLEGIICSQIFSEQPTVSVSLKQEGLRNTANALWIILGQTMSMIIMLFF